MMKSAPQSCGKNLLVRVSARRFFVSEALPQIVEAFAREGQKRGTKLAQAGVCARGGKMLRCWAMKRARESRDGDVG
jgi:hypothetical protein